LQVGEDNVVFKIPDPIGETKRWDHRVQVIDGEDEWVVEESNEFFSEYWADVKRMLRLKCGDPSRFEDAPREAG